MVSKDMNIKQCTLQYIKNQRVECLAVCEGYYINDLLNDCFAALKILSSR